MPTQPDLPGRSDIEADSASPTRPILRYPGGKWRLAPWIISHLPRHRSYVEPYGGSASVLLRKSRSCAEVYNDLDGEIVNVFRVLRDPSTAALLRDLLRATPFARDEFKAAYVPCEDPLEQARRTLIKSFMGFGSASIHDPLPAGMRTAAATWKAPTGFRSDCSRSGTTPAHGWRNYPDQIGRFTERLRGVVIENRDALAVMAQYDGAETVFYLDPPYVPSSRTRGSGSGGRRYTHEMDESGHRALAEAVKRLTGMVLISGYPSELYNDLYGGWRRIRRANFADRAAPRTEVLWLSSNAMLPQCELFSPPDALTDSLRPNRGVARGLAGEGGGTDHLGPLRTPGTDR